MRSIFSTLLDVNALDTIYNFSAAHLETVKSSFSFTTNKDRYIKPRRGPVFSGRMLS